MATNIFCRLCASKGILLSNLFRLDKDVYLNTKISACVGIKLQPGDGLSSYICINCEISVINFYEFKQYCLEIDKKMRENKFDEDLSTKLYNIKCDKQVSDIKTFESTNSILVKSTKKVINKRIDIYQCDICGSMIKRKKSFKRHLLKHTNKKIYKCKICLKQFTRSDTRKIHMRAHLGYKPYICDVCGKSSTKKQDLIRHMKVHSNEKRFACPKCDRCFKRSSDVSSHMRTHTGIRPYICFKCKKDYTSHSGWRKHYQKHCKIDDSENFSYNQ